MDFETWLLEVWAQANPGYLLTEDEAEERFNDELREIYPEFEIVGLKYDPAYTLKEVDPTAHRCGLVDWLDAAEFDEISIDGRLYWITNADRERAQIEFSEQETEQ